MGRLLVNALAILVGLAVVAGTSLVLTGTPLFGVLAGTGLQKALTPGLFAEVPAPETPQGGGRRGGPVPAEVARVVEGEVPVRLSFSGRLVAGRSVELRARVTGYLAERSFEEASFVEQGATLFRLDRRPFRTALDEARAALDGARADRDFLSREAERISQLEDQSFATESDLDELRGRRDQAEARVRELEAGVARAALELDYATIEAPFEGRIGFAEVDRGDLVRAGQTRLARLVQYDPIEVEIRPSATQLARLRARLETGEKVAIEVRRDGSDGVYEGEITGLGPAFSETTNTLPVRATLPNAERALIPGQFARVTADLGAERALLVPTRALVTTQNQRALYRLGEGDAVEVVAVETGVEHGGRTVVEGEIAPGDRVVVGNLQSVRPGAEVTPTENGERSASAEDGSASASDGEENAR